MCEWSVSPALDRILWLPFEDIIFNFKDYHSDSFIPAEDDVI